MKLTDNQNLRFSVSRTLARPEYRELAPDQEPRRAERRRPVEGNPDLERTRIQNADVRWEWYPNAGEVFSLGIFAKRFDKPIERVYRAVGSDLSLRRLRERRRGARTTARRSRCGSSWDSSPSRLSGLSLFTNATIMQVEIDLGMNQAAATNKKRRMVGQAPYVVNAGATYATRTGSTSATVLFNRVGERIDAAGDLPLPDVPYSRATRSTSPCAFRSSRRSPAGSTLATFSTNRSRRRRAPSCASSGKRGACSRSGSRGARNPSIDAGRCDTAVTPSRRTRHRSAFPFAGVERNSSAPAFRESSSTRSSSFHQRSNRETNACTWT